MGHKIVERHPDLEVLGVRCCTITLLFLAGMILSTIGLGALAVVAVLFFVAKGVAQMYSIQESDACLVGKALCCSCCLLMQVGQHVDNTARPEGVFAQA